MPGPWKVIYHRGFVQCSNTFQLEWPPRSGQVQSFPEIDRAEFFAEKLARKKIKPTQAPFFDCLIAALDQSSISHANRVRR
jgi:Predicted NTP pyrophosphohydrolase